MSELTRDEWLARRKTGVGGSEIAAICGLSPWKTPVQVWLDKVMDVQQDFSEDAEERMEWGNLLEEPVARKAAEKLGGTVRRNNKLLTDSVSPLIGNLDRILTLPDNSKAILEVKTTDARNLKAWQEDGIPAMYQLQVQSYMHLTGIQKAVVATLFGGQKLLLFEIAGDQETQQYICKIASDFWQTYVIPKVAPPLDDSSLTASTLNMLFPASNGQSITLPDESLQLISDYELFARAEKEAKADKDNAKMKLQAILGEAEQGIIGDRIVKWKTQERKGYEVKPSTYRDFRISTIKEK